MKLNRLLVLPILLFGLVCMIDSFKPAVEVQGCPAPPRHKVWCADNANYYCTSSQDEPHCGGATDPEWDNDWFCPPPRGRIYCPDPSYYYCDINEGGPFYCSRWHPNWDETWGECPE